MQLVMWNILNESRGVEHDQVDQNFRLQADDFRLQPVSENPRGAEAMERRLARLREIEATKHDR